MSGASERQTGNQAVAGRDVISARDVDLIVTGGIHVYPRENGPPPQEISKPTPPRVDPPAPDAVPRPDTLHAALAALRHPETCLYLGRRYGLTPQSSPPPGLLDGLDLGQEPPGFDSLAEAIGWLAGKLGLEAARRHLAEHYASLDKVTAEVAKELELLAPLAAGHSLVTGTYSARVQVALGSALTVVHGAGQLNLGLPPRGPQRTLLLMLHGSEHDFQNAMVADKDVLNYRRRRKAFAKEVSTLLRSPWIVLGAEKRADTTFHMLMSDVCDDLGLPQRPVFVVDPRPEHEVADEWPRAALRHVGMTPHEFLSHCEATER